MYPPDDRDDDPPRLMPGDEIRCKGCGRWHVLEHRDPGNPDPYRAAMLWSACPQAAGLFYLGMFAEILDADRITRWRPGNRLG